VTESYVFELPQETFPNFADRGFLLTHKNGGRGTLLGAGGHRKAEVCGLIRHPYRQRWTDDGRPANWCATGILLRWRREISLEPAIHRLQ